MMRVNPAGSAEIVFRGVRAEGVKAKGLRAFDDLQIVAEDTCGRGPPAAAIGTVTASRVFKTVAQTNG